MTYKPDIHRRHSIRLQGYDYSNSGAYFVTICTKNRECLFGDIVDGEMRVNDAGRMVQRIWSEIPGRYPDIEIDEFIVMPNHFHGIVVIVGAPLVGALPSDMPIDTAKPRADARSEPRADARSEPRADARSKTRAGTRPAPTLGDIVGTFKSITTYQYVDGVRQKNWPPFNSKFWQRNYYEHAIRDEYELDRIRQYIIDNPARWGEDSDHPGNVIRRGEVSSPSPVAIIQ